MPPDVGAAEAAVVGAGGARSFACIGAQKAGTTWLHAMLEEHPDVHVPSVKEVHYWNVAHPPHSERPVEQARQRMSGLRGAALARNMLRLGPSAALRERATAQAHLDLLERPGSPDDYLRFLARGRGGERAMGEVCPGYALLSSEVLAQMRRTLGDPLVIMILREPVARAWSGYLWGMQTWLRGEKTFREDRMHERFLDQLSIEDGPLRRLSDYRVTFEALDAVVPAEDVELVFYERLFDQSTMDALFARLGVASLPVDGGRAVNRTADRNRAPALPADVAAEATEILRPVHEAVKARVTEDLPEAWKRRFEARETDGQTDEMS